MVAVGVGVSVAVGSGGCWVVAVGVGVPVAVGLGGCWVVAVGVAVDVAVVTGATDVDVLVAVDGGIPCVTVAVWPGRVAVGVGVSVVISGVALGGEHLRATFWMVSCRVASGLIAQASSYWTCAWHHSFWLASKSPYWISVAR